jgi:FAD synthase
MRPTAVPDKGRVLEVHVPDVDEWIESYAERLSVHFGGWVRGRVRLDKLPVLVAQIGRYCDRVRRILSEGGA